MDSRCPVTLEPGPWTLDVPDGSAVFSISDAAGFTGHSVRIEIYVEGNLIGVAHQQF